MRVVVAAAACVALACAWVSQASAHQMRPSFATYQSEAKTGKPEAPVHARRAGIFASPRNAPISLIVHGPFSLARSRSLTFDLELEQTDALLEAFE